MDWQDKFLKLFMSKSIKDYSAALELKRNHIPSKLYRYRSANNISYIIDEISSGRIYLAHPKELNDPFDSCSIVKSDRPAHYFKDPNLFKESLRKHFSEDLLNKVFESENWYDELMELVAKENSSQVAPEKVVQSLTYAVMEQLLDVNKAFNQMVRSMSRLACFTTKYDNLPMWNHYASGHRGVCLEYESKNITNIYTLNRLFPVYYTDVLPDMLERSVGRNEPEFNAMDYFLIHKLKDWSYEAEWRLIYNAGSWYFSLEDIPKDFWEHGKELQLIRPSRVLLGAQISEQHEKLIRDVCGSYHIEAAKMECSEYGLRERHNG